MSDNWVVAHDNRALKPFTTTLQGFRCTDDPPRTPGGRPHRHPKQWEWEAQRHVRNLRRNFQGGDAAILRFADSDRDRLMGVLHLRPTRAGNKLLAAIEVIAVAEQFRVPGPPHVADDLFELARAVVADWASESTTQTVFAAVIHTQNRPSASWAKRHGFEPLAAPTVADLDSYISWRLRL